MARFFAQVETQRTHGVPDRWDIATYPKALPPDDRPKKVATERLVWARDGALAAAAGREYPAEDEPHLVTEAEWHRRQREARR